MHKSSLAALAGCLALAAAPTMAQGADRSWTGSALRYTPATSEGCNVSVMDAATRNGRVHVWLRNGGSGTLNFTLAGELAGNGQRSIGTATTRLPAGRNIDVPLMLVYRGSLAGSTLTLRGSACSTVG